MKKLVIVLLMAMTLMTLASCGGVTGKNSVPAPYGVDDRFLGLWEQVSAEQKIDGKTEVQSNTASAGDKYESYTFFMPNGSCIGFYRIDGGGAFDTDVDTWYTADPQFLQMGSAYWTYTFEGKNTLILTQVSEEMEYIYDANGNSDAHEYLETLTITLKRSDKRPGDLPQ